MVLRKTAERNREIFAAFQSGAPLDQLAQDYALNRKSICAILTAERHKRAVSPEPPYRDLRFPEQGRH
jgi:hypothetical protein